MLARIVVVLLLVAGCSTEQDPPAPAPAAIASIPVPPGAQEAVVVRHTDGDTLVLRGRGVGPLPAEPTKVRVLLIDTPEVRPTPECFGPEASRRVVELLPKGATVRVQGDRQPLDRFGRTLLHVWDSRGAHLGATLLTEGYATVLVVRPNVLHLEALRAAEATGRARGSGVWACPGN